MPVISGGKLRFGAFTIQAGVYIDCTGDADLPAWAGAGYEKGDNENNL